MWDLRMTAKASYSKYKMNVHQCTLDCSEYVEILASWNICAKGIWTLISELLQAAQAHLSLLQGNFLLMSMKKQKIYKKINICIFCVCFIGKIKPDFIEPQFSKNKKKNIALFNKADTKMGPSGVPWQGATSDSKKMIQKQIKIISIPERRESKNAMLSL